MVPPVPSMRDTVPTPAVSMLDGRQLREHLRIRHERRRFVSEMSCVTRSLNMFIVNDELIEKIALLCGIKNSRSVPDRHPWYRAKPRTSDSVTFVVRVRRFTVNVLYDWGVGHKNQRIDVRDDSRELGYYARRRDHHLLLRCARLRPDRLDGFNNIHAFDNFAKHNVPPIEPGCNHCRNEELVMHTFPCSADHTHVQQP
jgi:hypothetical protein